MKIQVLVAAMDQNDHSLPEKMNICTDAIIGNQCDRNSVESFQFNGSKITYLNFAERGVGLNRNNALMRADADVVLFSDDDIVYLDDYDKVIENAFNDIPDADVIIFNVNEKVRERYVIPELSRVGYFNYLRYGTARIAVRLKSIRDNGIYFNQCFGGGTEHCHGEDNIFLSDCLKKKLKIYAFPQAIANLSDERQSSWNRGYNEKYLRDQGILYRTISRKWWRLLCLQDAVRHSSLYNLSPAEVYRVMRDGALKHT